MTSPKPLPPNIQEFNEITAVIFAQLYNAHPFPKDLDPDEVASVLAISRADKMPSGRIFNDVFAHTVSWLTNQGFVFSCGAHPRERAILTAKTLTAMNVVPPSLNQSRGSELVDATKQASSATGRNTITEHVGTLIGSIIKSVID